MSGSLQGMQHCFQLLNTEKPDGQVAYRELPHPIKFIIWLAVSCGLNLLIRLLYQQANICRLRVELD